MALATGGATPNASFFFAVNIRAALSVNDKTISDLAVAAGIDANKLSSILSTTSDANANLSLNEAYAILNALRALCRLSGWVTFEDFCNMDIAEDHPRSL